jgi:tRNA A-37 threonylcarbamoyl transferase component Bud32
MTTLLERLRDALAPDYEVEREVASGGMGVVFLGRDVALDRRVAIKIIRPELATAAAAERFVREARVLASLNHPNIVPVHRAGESRGFSYYVMDYLEAETLAERLAAGPLAPGEALALGRDVLAALEVVHQRGVVHRDVKPANIFLVEGRAVLTDFGIAKATATHSPPLTADGRVVGSPGYMAPEQMAGGEVTPATDVFAVGLVLYEAFTGEPWPFPSEVAHASWTRVPAGLVRVLMRALAWKAGDRWKDAAAYRRALETAVGRARGRRAIHWGVGVAALASLAVVAGLLLAPGPARSTTLRLKVRPFSVEPAAMAGLGDSLAAALVQGLGANPDFSVELDRGTPAGRDSALAIEGSGEIANGMLRLTLRSDTVPGSSAPLYATAYGSVDDWRRLASDSLSHHLLVDIWNLRGGKLAARLPLHALPRSAAGLEALIGAERLFARAQWENAYRAYERAIAVDSTCLLCLVRLTDVGRWLGKVPDSTLTARYRAALDSFPPQYQLLIEASFAKGDERWQLLKQVTERYPDFGLGWFIRGDAIFHRGPVLGGYRRHDALAFMQHATVVWPDFAPAWEHLAWIAIGEGDSVTAGKALETLARLGAGEDEFSAGLHTLLQACYLWRFGAPSFAEEQTRTLLRSPSVERLRDLGAGARYMMSCDAPRGAVQIGQAFQQIGRADLVIPGLQAQVYGYLALGREDSALVAAARLRSETSNPSLALFAAELGPALLFADSASETAIARDWPAARRALDVFLDAGSGAEDLQLGRRAAWLLALLARRAGEPAASRFYRHRLDDEPAPRTHASPLGPYASLLDADAEARRGRPDVAISRSAWLVTFDSSGQAGEPFFRSFLHLMRAQWYADQLEPLQAERELRWHEGNDLRDVTYSGAPPEEGEIDWALGTLARWRRARLLDGAPGDAEACDCYGAVARLWSGGEPRFAARADSARQRIDALHCSPQP